MKILGIIAEYNPFHNGHKYHIEKSKKLTNSDAVVCIMSGNFIQRGEPSILDKWSRAQCALLNGVDLIIELPVVYSIQSAEFFAYGGIKLLNNLNIIDYLSFGSESGNIEDFLNIGQVLYNESVILSSKIKHYLKEGISYPLARQKALCNYLDNDYSYFLTQPNNILGVEYIKALLKIKSNIKPVTVKRNKVGYNEIKTVDNFASATAIRKMIRKNNIEDIKQYVPESSYNIIEEKFNNNETVYFNDFTKSIFTLLTRLSTNEISNYPDVNEGLENRIKKSLGISQSLSDLVNNIKSKRYAQTRIQRIVFNILLNITKSKLDTFQELGGPGYIRVLGMNKTGKKILKTAKEQTKSPVIIKPSSYNQYNLQLINEMIQYDFNATDIYYLHKKVEKKLLNIDLKTSPIIF